MNDLYMCFLLFYTLHVISCLLIYETDKQSNEYLRSFLSRAFCEQTAAHFRLLRERDEWAQQEKALTKTSLLAASR